MANVSTGKWHTGSLFNMLDIYYETVCSDTNHSAFLNKLSSFDWLTCSIITITKFFGLLFIIHSNFFQPGAFQFILKMAGTLSIIIACIPPVFYIIICFITKTNTQITIAAIMSVLYAFLMTASFFSIIGGYNFISSPLIYVFLITVIECTHIHSNLLLGDMVVQGTFLTPTGVFLVSMAIMYLVTAILHPEEMGKLILLSHVDFSHQFKSLYQWKMHQFNYQRNSCTVLWTFQIKQQWLYCALLVFYVFKSILKLRCFAIFFFFRIDCLWSDVFHLYPQWIPPTNHLLTG